MSKNALGTPLGAKNAILAHLQYLPHENLIFKVHGNQISSGINQNSPPKQATDAANKDYTQIIKKRSPITKNDSIIIPKLTHISRKRATKPQKAAIIRPSTDEDTFVFAPLALIFRIFWWIFKKGCAGAFVRHFLRSNFLSRGHF